MLNKVKEIIARLRCEHALNPYGYTTRTVIHEDGTEETVYAKRWGTCSKCGKHLTVKC